MVRVRSRILSLANQRQSREGLCTKEEGSKKMQHFCETLRYVGCHVTFNPFFKLLCFWTFKSKNIKNNLSDHSLIYKLSMWTNRRPTVLLLKF